MAKEKGTPDVTPAKKTRKASLTEADALKKGTRGKLYLALTGMKNATEFKDLTFTKELTQAQKDRKYGKTTYYKNHFSSFLRYDSGKFWKIPEDKLGVIMTKVKSYIASVRADKEPSESAGAVLTFAEMQAPQAIRSAASPKAKKATLSEKFKGWGI